MMRPPVSIIVVFHSGKHYLKACLDSIQSSMRPDDEIIVVANNQDESALGLTDLPSSIRLITRQESLGYAGAANLGAEHAFHTHVVFCDHDLVFLPGWLDQLWQTYTSRPNIGACSCKAINPHSMAVLDFGIAFSNFNGAHPGLDLPQAHPLVQTDRVVQAVCTSGFLISLTDFNATGRFDVAFGSMYTDLDLCLQLKRMGRVVVSSANAVAYHFGGDFHQAGDKAYKASHLKADIKGTFMRKHADVLEVDLERYFTDAYAYDRQIYGELPKALYCNMMNVADPAWYEELASRAGMRSYAPVRIPSGQRDAHRIGLFETLGFETMRSNMPIAYFVDRYTSVLDNAFWWERRAAKGDLIIDRNANVVRMADLASRQR
jgi:GT2 family glycosyltransferase